MQYPLREKIGRPDLLVGRAQEFSNFNKWLDNIPNLASKSRVILARRKSGKTSFVQRIFNQLWSANGQVIPFYMDIAERKIWYPNFAIEYFRTFASQYIAFLERDPLLVKAALSLEKIRAYGVTHAIQPLVDDVDLLEQYRVADHGYDIMWSMAYSAPHRYADIYEQRVLVILDEFQNITQYIYRDEECQGQPDESMAGSPECLSSM